MKQTLITLALSLVLTSYVAAQEHVMQGEYYELFPINENLNVDLSELDRMSCAQRLDAILDGADTYGAFNFFHFKIKKPATIESGWNVFTQAYNCLNGTYGSYTGLFDPWDKAYRGCQKREMEIESRDIRKNEDGLVKDITFGKPLRYVFHFEKMSGNVLPVTSYRNNEFTDYKTEKMQGEYYVSHGCKDEGFWGLVNDQDQMARCIYSAHIRVFMLISGKPYHYFGSNYLEGLDTRSYANAIIEQIMSGVDPSALEKHLAENSEDVDTPFGVIKGVHVAKALGYCMNAFNRNTQVKWPFPLNN